MIQHKFREMLGVFQLAIAPTFLSKTKLVEWEVINPKKSVGHDQRSTCLVEVAVEVHPPSKSFAWRLHGGTMAKLKMQCYGNNGW